MKPDQTIAEDAIVSLTDAAAALDRLLAAASDKDARAALTRARRAISQTGGGRPAIDDRRLLADARHLVESGRAKSAWQAYCLVARAADPFGSTRSIAERLRRKDAEQR